MELVILNLDVCQYWVTLADTPSIIPDDVSVPISSSLPPFSTNLITAVTVVPSTAIEFGLFAEIFNVRHVPKIS
jgi:hypothetical protein